MGNFQVWIEKPEEIEPHLGKPEHWKKGRSAFELSTAWMNAKGIPASVRSVLDQAPEWQDARFLEGIFERKTDLPGRGRASQTDLLAIVRLADGNAILGVEGKVDEPFDKLVQEWIKEAPAGKPGETLDDKAKREKRSADNRRARLGALCMLLGVDPAGVDGLHYQLFHRTCASIYEAQRFGFKRALMLVHSFAEVPMPPGKPACFEDFSAFAHYVGMPVIRPGTASSPKHCDGVEVRLAWASDNVSP